jgi:hypothetical protein
MLVPEPIPLPCEVAHQVWQATMTEAAFSKSTFTTTLIHCTEHNAKKRGNKSKRGNKWGNKLYLLLTLQR